MQSAKTSLPYASVLPIYTVKPFLDLMISSGLYELLSMKFYANPIAATTFCLIYSLATVSNAESTDVAPCLSICISLIPAVGLRWSPPVSKHRPLPINPWNLSLYCPPLYYKQMKIGAFLLALPTACINLNPYSRSLSPFMTVILIFL